MKSKFTVSGMSCAACSARVEKSVGKLLCVKEVSVNLLTGSMVVEYKDGADDDAVINAVVSAGYGAVKVGKNQEKSGIDVKKVEKDDDKRMKVRLIVSIAFWIPLMIIAMSNMFFDYFHLAVPDFWAKSFYGHENAVTFALTQIILLTPIVVVNRKYFIGGFKAIIKKSPNMDTLVALGSSVAIVYGIFALYMIGYGLGHGNHAMAMEYSCDLYFESAGTILTLITVGKYLEARSKRKTSEAITKLIDLTPKTATVIRNGEEVVINAEEVVVGDVFLLKPGDSVPVDGEIIEGRTSFDESAVTGESIPVEKQKGDKVISATINKSGFVKVRATRVGEDTTISRLIKLVEEASASKAPISKLADKISGVFVPTVVIIAVISFIVWLCVGRTFEFALARAISVLVISCPCALGLATPVAIMVGTGKGAENGILIKSGEAIQTLAGIDTVIIDKTGTATEGKPTVTDIVCYNVDEERLIALTGAVEKMSEHPLAEAVLNEQKRLSVPELTAKDFEAVFGKGVKAKVDEESVFVGNLPFMEESGIIVEENVKEKVKELAAKGKTPLVVAENARIIGIIAVADKVKKGTVEAIERFKTMGLRVVMLTGDNQITAEAVKNEIGADEVIAGVLPDGKAKVVEEIKKSGHKVAMVGDGINDAPALTAADVGLAIGDGTDIAIESADVVLTKSDLNSVADGIILGRKVLRNIKENLFWAFFYNSVGIPIAAGVLVPVGFALNPMFGAAAMSLSSVCVVCNALRLRGVKLNKNNKKSQKKEKKNMNKTIYVDGMMCMHCAGAVKKALEAINGVKSAEVNLSKKSVTLELTLPVSDETLRAAVEKAGYKMR